MLLITIGDVYQQHERQEQALESYQQALQQYQQLDTQQLTTTEREAYCKLEADLYERIGKVQAERGVTQEAQESYQQSLTLYQNAKDSTGEIRILHALDKTQQLVPVLRLLAPIPRRTRVFLAAIVLLLIRGGLGGLVFQFIANMH